MLIGMSPEEIQAAFDRVRVHLDAPEAYLKNAGLRACRTFGSLPPGEGTKALLDVGGMNGLFAAIYFDVFRYKSVNVIGNDAPASGVVKVRHDGGEYEIAAKQCDIEMERWPFEDESFDTIVCTEVLEHMLFDPMFVANEMCRVLKPGGQVLVTVPNTVSDECLLHLLNDRQPGYLRYYNTLAVQRGTKDIDAIANMGHFHEYTRSDLECLLKAAGFEGVEVRGFSYKPANVEGFRFNLALKLLRWMFPRARRIHETNLLATGRKKEYRPLAERAERFPAPLYRTIH